MKLQGLLENVCDERSFLIFLQALRHDRMEEVQKEKLNPSSPYGAGAKGWANTTIEGFLESAIAWAEDSKNGHSTESNPWKRCAEILHMGKHYE